MNRFFAWIACLALSIGLLAGCGGGGGSETPAPNVTAAGGTIVSADGKARIVVPAGAVDRPMSVQLVPSTAEGPPTLGVLAGHRYVLQGDGGALSAEASIAFVLDSGAVPLAATTRKRALSDVVSCALLYGLWVTPTGSTYCGLAQAPPTLATLGRDVAIALDNCVYETASRTLSCRLSSLADRIFGVLYDSTPPTVSLSINSSSFTAPGDLVASIAASDNRGLNKTILFMSRSIDGVLDSGSLQLTEFTGPSPYTATRGFTAADNGVWTLRVGASDNNGNIGYASPPAEVTVAIPTGPGPDLTPPTVSLAVSTTAAVVGDSVTLSASANDDVGVAKVEFYRGAIKLGERLAAPFDFSPPAYVAGDVGTPQVYTARAFDAAANTSSSAPVTVNVSAPPAAEWFVNAGGGSDANAGSAASPFKTLAQAFSVAVPGATVWLQDGLFDAAGEGTNTLTGRTVPAELSLRAVHSGGATIGFPLVFAGSGSLVGVQLDISAGASVKASQGTVTLSQPTWVRLGGANAIAALQASGSAQIQLDAGGHAAHEYIVAPGVQQLALLEGNAQLTVNGGVIDRVAGGGAGYMNLLAGNSRLTLNSVTWRDSTGVVVAATVVEVLPGGAQLTMNDTQIDFTGAIDFTGGGNACIRVRALPGDVTTQTINLTNTTLKGCPGDAIQIRGGTPTLLLSGSSITGTGYYGLRAGKVFGQPEEATPTVTLSNSVISGSGSAGIDLNGGGSLAMSGSTVSNNGLLSGEGGVRLRDDKTYGFTLRGSNVSDNNGSASSGGVVLQGNAASVFDLGSQVSPGGNTLRNNGTTSTGLRMAVAAGLRVDAVGNNWNLAVQGSNAAGAYVAGSALCGGANPCDVAAGSGLNFVVGVAGASLRLVHE
jgi:hypothetical protein